MEQEINLDDATQWVSFKDYTQEISQVMTYHQLRELMRNRATNGLSEVTCKPGKNLLIHRTGFGRWLRGQK